MQDKFPKLYLDRSDCCGCSVCSSLCMQNAIEMRPDKEGFLYPAVNITRCNGCGRCLKVCIFKQDKKHKSNAI